MVEYLLGVATGAGLFLAGNWVQKHPEWWAALRAKIGKKE